MLKLRDKRLYWRGDIIWARVLGPTGRYERRSTKCRTEEAAIGAANALERRATDPTYAAASATSLGGVMHAYFTDLDRRGRADATKKIARQKAGHFVRVWGQDMPIVKVTAQLVLDYIDQRTREGVTRHTVKLEMGHLRQMLALARHVGTFHEEAGRIFPPFYSKGYKPRTRWVSAEEIVKLRDELEPRRMAHLAFIVATGARLSESVKARRSDVDWAAKLVRIRGTKTRGAAAEVPITRVSATMLAWALEHAPGADLLFHPWGKLHRDVAAACARIGIAKFTPNDLRRTLGHHLLGAGVNIQSISKVLRHTTDKLAQTTYANATGAEMGPIIDAQILDSATVPNLYLGSGPTRQNEDQHGGDQRANTVVFAVPPAEIESAANALGKLSCETPPAAEFSVSGENASATIVPELYHGNLPPWAREAVGVLRGLARARGVEVGT